jgi:hypothetical protein
LSGRLTYIASIYKSLDNIDEAILATTLALVFDSIEASLTQPSNSKQSSDLVSWLATFTENVVVVTSNNHALSSSSEQRLGLQNSLLQLLLKRDRSTWVSSTVGNSRNNSMDALAFVDMLLESLDRCKNESCCTSFEKHCNVPFNLATILSSLISNKVIPRHGEIDKSSAMIEFVKLLTELIVRFGHVLQRSEQDSTSITSASINDFLSMCHFTESLISKLAFEDSFRLPLVLAMMNLVASISLVSAHPSFKFEGWMTDSFSRKTQRGKVTYFEVAKSLIDNAYSTLNESNVCDQAFSASLCAIELYRYQMSQFQGGELNYDINLKLFQEFDGIANSIAVESLTGNKGLNWQLCLTITLTRLCTVLYLDGEGLRALQIAKWSCSSALGVSRDTRVWSETMLLTLIAESSIITIHATNTDSFSHPDNFELKACKLRLYARDGDYRVSFIESQFQSLLATIWDLSATFGPEFDDIISWSTTTIYLGLSECAERQGCLEASLVFLKKCFEGCRKAISATKRMNSTPASDRHCSPWHITRQTYIALSSLKRQAKCLYRMAHLYNRTGNYRKSLEYSFASLHSPLLEEAGLTSKSSFAEAMSLTRQFPARNSSETMVRRLYLRFKSLACSLDLVTDQFLSDDYPCLSRVDDAIKGTELFVNCELEAIVDLYESKYYT